jgi:hypothetical protein
VAEEGGDAERIDILCAIARAQAQAGDRAGAEATFARALRSALQAQQAEGPESRSYDLSRVADAQAQAGWVEAAIATYRRIGPDTTEDEARSQVIYWLAEAGNLDAARAEVEQMSPQVRSLREARETLARAQLRAGDVASARATWPYQEKYGRFEVKFESELIRAKAMSGDVAGARADAEKLDPYYSRPSALQEIAEVQAGAGAIAAARATVQSITEDDRRAIALAASALTQSRKLDMAGASRTFTEALALAAGMPQVRKDLALLKISVCQARSGDYAGARKTLEGVYDEFDKRCARRKILALQTEAGDVNGARKEVESYEDAGLEALGLAEMARVLAGGKPERWP